MNSKKLIKKRIVEQDWSKIPPQAIDLECAILGAMILDWDSNDLCRQVATWLKPEMFYKEANQLVMEAILQQPAKRKMRKPNYYYTVKSSILSNERISGK